MNMTEMMGRLIAKGGKCLNDCVNAFNEEFGYAEVLALLQELVKLAEEVVTGEGTGKEKHALVREVFDRYDKKYGLVKKIDDLIPLNPLLEPFDDNIIRWGVDLIIKTIVNVKWPRSGQAGSSDATGLKEYPSKD